ncbi:MAG: DctP family TRAP transporter solute-binding subunit, partial [Campylobacterales bacterium]|nr:DctP family TRAP transporter solute-binding subunit [Campylobacterales bacterium]
MMKYLNIFMGVVLFGLVIFITFFYLRGLDDEYVQKQPSQQNDVVHLRFGHNTPQDSALHQAALRFAKIVEEKTEHKVKIDIFDSQKLGNDHQMVEMARAGELDIVLTPTVKMSVAVPSMQYADLPFLFPTREDAYMLLDGEVGKMLLDDLREIGLVGITFWENGFKNFTGNQPFLTPDDFKGKKIRVMKSRIIMQQFKAFGAQPIPIDFHATKKALQDKIVDGQENPLVAIVSMGFHEVQSDLVLSEHAYLGYVFCMSEKVFKQLPQNIREIVFTTAKEVTPWEREETQRREAKLLDIIAKSGVKIHKLTKKQKEEFAKKTSYIIKQYEDVIGSDIISKTEEILLEKYGPNPSSKEQIVIGIDVDLSADGKEAGLAIKRGVELAVDEINEDGGLLGKRVQIITKDHKTISTTAVENIKSLAKRDDLVAIVGGKHSAVIASEIDSVNELKIPFLIPWAAAKELTQNIDENSFIFRVSANDKFISQYLAKQALKHGKKITLIVENSIWGRGNIKDIENCLEKNGAEYIKSVVINRGQKLFDKEIQEMIKTKTDVLIFVTNSIESSALIKALSIYNLTIPIISHWGIIGNKFYEQNSKYLENMSLEYIQSFSFEKAKTKHAKELKDAYIKKYFKDETDKIYAPNGVAQAYDAIKLLAMAIKKANSTDGYEIKKALEDLEPYDGVVKYYKQPFTPQNHDALSLDDFCFVKFDAKKSMIKNQK